jgi:hypothetical protein
MSITVNFRGPMLYVSQGGILQRILIPDASVAAPFPDGHTPRHAHTAGLFVDPARPVWTLGFDLTISDNTHTPCNAAGMVGLIDMKALANGLTLRKDTDPQVSSVVSFDGGTAVATLPSNNQYYCPITHGGCAGTPRTLPLIVSWVTNAPSATLTFQSRSGGQPLAPIQLQNGDTVFVFNFDLAPKSANDYQQQAPKCNGTKPKPDEDFKFLYALFNTPTGGWGNWLNKSELPAPYYLCDAKAEPMHAVARGQKDPAGSPGDGDCIGACWC